MKVMVWNDIKVVVWTDIKTHQKIQGKVVQVLKKDPGRTLEAIQIRRTARPMNLDRGLHLSPVWNPLIDQTWTI